MREKQILARAIENKKEKKKPDLLWPSRDVQNVCPVQLVDSLTSEFMSPWNEDSVVLVI